MINHLLLALVALSRAPFIIFLVCLTVAAILSIVWLDEDEDQ